MRKSWGGASPESARILLVDDNRDGLIARKSVLEELGYSTSLAHSSEEAIEQLARGSFNLVVTDYKMPRINGIELIRRIRKARPDTPVILLSGFVEPLGLDEKATGADVVIAKSAREVDHLVRAVARILKRRPARKPTAPEKASAGTNRARAKGA